MGQLAHRVPDFLHRQPELFTETRETEWTFSLLGKLTPQEARQRWDAAVAQEVEQFPVLRGDAVTGLDVVEADGTDAVGTGRRCRSR